MSKIIQYEEHEVVSLFLRLKEVHPSSFSRFTTFLIVESDSSLYTATIGLSEKEVVTLRLTRSRNSLRRFSSAAGLR